MDPVDFQTLTQQLSTQLKLMGPSLEGEPFQGLKDQLQSMGDLWQETVDDWQRVEREAEERRQQLNQVRKLDQVPQQPPLSKQESAAEEPLLPRVPRPEYPHQRQDIWDPGLSVIDDYDSEAPKAPPAPKSPSTPTARPASEKEKSVTDSGITEFE